MSLKRIGFADDEVFRCVAWTDGRVGVNAEIHGEKAVLLLNTALRLDVRLSGPYAHRRGFPLVRGSEAAGNCSLTEFRALGRSRRYDDARFMGAPQPDTTSIYAGEIGIDYLSDAVLGVDAAGPHIGLSTRDEISPWSISPVCRIPLVPESGPRLAVTVALRDGHAPEAAPAFAFGTGYPFSYLSEAYVKDRWSRKTLKRLSPEVGSKRTVPVPLTLPNGDVISLAMRIETGPPEYVVDTGMGELQGMLGIDFLRRWMQVFDLPGRELLLFDY